MTRLLPIFLALMTVVCASYAIHAEEPEAKPLWKSGLRGTVGSAGYVGRGAYLQFGDVWRVKGSYSDYRFDGSTGTTRTASVRGAYQGERLAAGVTMSVTPRNDFYANRAFGADAGWTFMLDDSDEPSGLEELEVGGWWTQTRHSQIIPATGVQRTQRDVVINQHDFGLSAALTGWSFTLSLDAFRTVYDQDFSNLPAAALRVPRLGQTASLVNGFPERGGAARLEYARWRACVPYVSISTSKYKLQPQPASTTSAVGVALRSGSLGLDLGFERTRQAGSPDSRYFNFGGSLRF